MKFDMKDEAGNLMFSIECDSPIGSAESTDPVASIESSLKELSASIESANSAYAEAKKYVNALDVLARSIEADGPADGAASSDNDTAKQNVLKATGEKIAAFFIKIAQLIKNFAVNLTNIVQNKLINGRAKQALGVVQKVQQFNAAAKVQPSADIAPYVMLGAEAYDKLKQFVDLATHYNPETEINATELDEIDKLFNEITPAQTAAEINFGALVKNKDGAVNILNGIVGFEANLKTLTSYIYKLSNQMTSMAQKAKSGSDPEIQQKFENVKRFQGMLSKVFKIIVQTTKTHLDLIALGCKQEKPAPAAKPAPNAAPKA